MAKTADHQRPSDHQHNSFFQSLVPIIFSAGLFVVTALLSQWVQQERRRLLLPADNNSNNNSDHDDDDDDYDLLLHLDDEEADEELQRQIMQAERERDLRKLYRLRRQEIRLSFSGTSGSLDVSNENRSDDNDRAAVVAKGGGAAGLTSLREGRRRQSLDTDEDAFYPKNSNWNHFEFGWSLEQRESEQCRQGGGGSSVPHPTTRWQHSLANSLEGDRDTVHASANGDYESSEDEDEVSLRSESHFVWTEAHYSPRNGPRPSRNITALPAIHSDQKLDTLTIGASAGVPILPPAAAAGVAPLPPTAAAPANRTSIYSTAISPRMPTLCHAHSMDERPKSKNAEPNNDNDSSFPLPSTTLQPLKPRPSTKLPTVPPADRRRLQERSLSVPLSARRSMINDDDDSSQSDVSDMEQHNRVARAKYNARIMPDKLILLRHGQSRGNIDEKLYSTLPDNAIPLTKLGWEQARAAGRKLRDEIMQQHGEDNQEDVNVHFIVSPYVRTVETFHGLVSAWCDPNEFRHIVNRDERRKAWYTRLVEMGISWAEDPRIREQDFGNLQDPKRIKESKKERQTFGAFYYRFAHGESASDVFDRMSTFLDSLWRSFDMNKSRYFVLVTHGISIRVLLARYFRYTIDQFHLLSNPRNCEMIVLEHDGQGRLQFAGRHELECRQEQNKDGTTETRVVKYHYHKRMRVLPAEHIRKVHIRIDYDD